MLQGTTEEAARNIVNNGFAAVATVDAGWSGRGQKSLHQQQTHPLFATFLNSVSHFSFAGIYFTRDVSYASLYSSNTPKVFVLAVVNIGNLSL